MSRASRTRAAVLSIGAVAALALTGCSSGAADGTTEITLLVDNGEAIVTTSEAVIEAFEAEYPDIRVKLDTRPAGTEGDNLIKTRLSTGEMDEVFLYNSGSLLQALNPDQTLVDLSDEPWVDGLGEDFLDVVSGENGIYGAPYGTSFAGGIVYNKRVYEDLGLEIPESWDEFMANNAKIKAAGIDPIIQTYGETFTSQLFVLADYANVDAADPEWAEGYTAHERSYADEPALAGFRHLQEAFEAGYYNEDFASANLDDGTRMVAEGTGAHYPILTGILPAIQQNTPDLVDDVGYFALPADDPANTQATIWQPNAVYIPKTAEGDKLEAAKTFVEFLNSEGGCEAQNATGIPSGPYVGLCELPEDVPAMLHDIEAYVDEGRFASALEFLSPIKGPNLENITVEVGSGITPAEEGAALYDQDVEKQAQQLGLEGW